MFIFFSASLSGISHGPCPFSHVISPWALEHLRTPGSYLTIKGPASTSPRLDRCTIKVRSGSPAFDEGDFQSELLAVDLTIPSQLSLNCPVSKVLCRVWIDPRKSSAPACSATSELRQWPSAKFSFDSWPLRTILEPLFTSKESAEAYWERFNHRNCQYCWRCWTNWHGEGKGWLRSYKQARRDHTKSRSRSQPWNRYWTNCQGFKSWCSCSSYMDSWPPPCSWPRLTGRRFSWIWKLIGTCLLCMPGTRESDPPFTWVPLCFGSHLSMQEVSLWCPWRRKSNLSNFRTCQDTRHSGIGQK